MVSSENSLCYCWTGNYRMMVKIQATGRITSTQSQKWTRHRKHRQKTTLISWPPRIMIKDNQSLPVFLFSACIRQRDKEGESKHEHTKAQTRVLIYILHSNSHKMSIITASVNLGGTSSFLGSIHTQWWDANSVVNPWTQLQIELWLEWSRSADHRGFQPCYRCESPSDWLPELPWWE